MYQASVSVARRLPLNQSIEVGYVGTFGRNLTAKPNVNVIPEGGLETLATLTSEPAAPRGAVGRGGQRASGRSRAYGNLFYLENIGDSNYHALQATLSRQPAGTFQYLLAYTLSQGARARRGGDFGQHRSLRPRPLLRHAALRPAAQRGTSPGPGACGDPAPGAACPGRSLNGWNLSGISTYASGEPHPRRLHRRHRQRPGRARLVGHPRPCELRPRRAATGRGRHHADLHLRPAAGAAASVGEKILDVNCIGDPGLRPDGRRSSRPTTCACPAGELPRPHGLQGLRDRAATGGCSSAWALFNIFNQAYPSFAAEPGHRPGPATRPATSAVTACPTASGGTTDNVCDPTGGYRLTAEHDRELRQDHHQARAPRGGVRPEAVLLGRGGRPRRKGGRAAAFPLRLQRSALTSSGIIGRPVGSPRV